MKTDKKIEEILKKLIYKSYSFTADWNTDGEATSEEEAWMQTYYKEDAQQAISSKIYKEALEELNTEVQKQVEEAVRGFAEEIISKLSADVVTPVEIDGLDNRYYKAEKILTLIHDLQNEVIERILK